MIGRNAAIAEVGPRRRELHGFARVRVVARRARLAAQRLPRPRQRARLVDVGLRREHSGRRPTSTGRTPPGSTGTSSAMAPRRQSREGRFRGEPAVELDGRRPHRRLHPGARDDRRLVAIPRRGVPRAPRRPRRARAGTDRRAPAARAVGEPAVAVAGTAPRASPSTLDGLDAPGRRQRAADPRLPRRRARVVGRSALDPSATPPGSERRSPWTRPPSRSRTASRSPPSSGSRRSASTPRSSRPGGAAVPMSFGWHPYLRLPGGTAPRRGGSGCPSRQHLTLDDRGIPTGDVAARAGRSGRRSAGARSTTATRSAVTAGSRSSRDDGHSLELHGRSDYPFAQVWVPPRQAVRRARADDRAHQRTGRRHRRRRPRRRHVHRHPSRLTLGQPH